MKQTGISKLFFAALLVIVCSGMAFALPAAGMIKVILYDSTPEAAPVEGASVYLSYWSFNNGGGSFLAEEGPFITDAEGTVTRDITADTEKDFVVKATYRDISVEKTVKWYGGLTTRLTLPIGSVTVTLEDPKGLPIENKSVTISGSNFNLTENTDAKGAVVFTRINLQGQYAVSIPNGKETLVVNASAVSATKVVVPVYDITVNVVDEEGTGFPDAEVKAIPEAQLEQVKRTDKNGVAVFERLAPGSLSLSSFVGGTALEKDMNITNDESVYLVLDLKKPILDSVNVADNEADKEPKLLIAAHDQGAYGSGIESVAVTYSLDKKNWIPIPATKTAGQFSASVPKMKEGTVVYYHLQIIDKAGNTFEGGDGSFTVLAANGGGSGGNGGTNGSGAQGTDYLPFVVVVVIIIAAVTYFGWTKLRQAGNA